MNRKPDIYFQEESPFQIQLMQPIYRLVDIALKVVWAPLGRLLAFVLRRRNQIDDGTNEFAADRESDRLAGDSR